MPIDIKSAKNFDDVKKIAFDIQNVLNNNSYIKIYKEHLNRLKIIKNNFKNYKYRQKFNLPKNLYAYSSIGKNCAKELDLRILGQSVGTIKIKNKKITFSFKDGILNFIDEKEISNNIGKEYQWDKIRKYRRYIKNINVNEEINKLFKGKKKNKEAVCESIILNCLSGKKSIKTKGIVPVMIADRYYFQFKTKISASKKTIRIVENTYNKNNKEKVNYGGGVDILARTKDKKLCVIELKDDNAKGENAYKVLGQAVAYSVFVGELFINGWSEYFGFKNIGKSPTIHAVVCMPKAYNKELDIKDFAKNVIEIKDKCNKTKFKIDCHYIYYDKNEIKKGKFVIKKNSLGLNDKR